MCPSGIVVALLLFIQTKAGIVDHGDHFNSIYAPPAVNFNDIFSNSLSLLAEEPSLTTGAKDDDLHLTIPTQFVEFRIQKQETTPMTTTPPPMYLLNSSYLKKATETDGVQNSTSTTAIPSSSSTNPAEKLAVNVVPIQKEIPERGVLDLLFPASRVRSFKGVFDTFRRVLSHTFRKR